MFKKYLNKESFYDHMLNLTCTSDSLGVNYLDGVQVVISPAYKVQYDVMGIRSLGVTDFVLRSRWDQNYFREPEP